MIEPGLEVLDTRGRRGGEADKDGEAAGSGANKTRVGEGGVARGHGDKNGEGGVRRRRGEDRELVTVFRVNETGLKQGEQGMRGEKGR